MIGDLELARPLGALAILLAPALFLLSRPRLRPEARATGALALWLRVAPAVPEGGRRRRRRVPPATWALALALVLGGLALAGPRLRRPPAERHWTVVVDRRPGLYLPLDGRDGPTRLEAALDRASEWLRGASEPGDRVRWTSPQRAELDLAPGERPPAEWLERSPWPAPEPEWAWLDLPGHLWLSDRQPGQEPGRAGLVLSGGEDAPGPVAVEAGRRVSWDGQGLLREPETSAPRRLDREPAGVRGPEPLERWLGVWAAAAGFEAPTSGSPELVVQWSDPAVDARPQQRAPIGRDGWSAEASFPAGGLGPAASGPLPTPWLTLEDGTVLVDAAPGRIRLALTELSEPAGDPAAFAVSWAELFEGAALLPPGVVALEHRRAAGPPRLLEPAQGPAPTSDGVDRPPPPLQAWLAGASAVLALVALVLAGLASARAGPAGSR